MDPTPPPRPGVRSDRLARGGEVEGWFSLAFVILSFLIPASPPLTEAFSFSLLISTFGAAAMLALSGLRFARGPGRWSAAVSLAILSLALLALAS